MLRLKYERACLCSKEKGHAPTSFELAPVKRTPSYPLTQTQYQCVWVNSEVASGLSLPSRRSTLHSPSVQYETYLLYRRAQVKAGEKGYPLSPAIGIPLRKQLTFSAA